MWEIVKKLLSFARTIPGYHVILGSESLLSFCNSAFHVNTLQNTRRKRANIYFYSYGQGSLCQKLEGIKLVNKLDDSNLWGKIHHNQG